MVQQKARSTKPSVARRYTEDEVKQTMEKYYGNHALICAALDCSPQQFNVWLRSPSHKQMLEDARSRILDKSEEKMLALLDSKDEHIVMEAAKFILTRLGRSRGYGGDSPALQVNVSNSGDELKLQVNQVFGI